MIIANLYFEKGMDTDGIVNSLQKLPALIKPIYFAEDEGKIIKKNVLTDEKRFRDFQLDNPLGFFLYTESKANFNISNHSVGYAEVSMWLEDETLNELVIDFIQCLTKFEPIFGYSCYNDEYKYRNRYYITLGKNHIEDWIGRKLEKYISGVYWYTLLSDELLNKHHVNLVDLSAEAISTETLGNGDLYLLKFFGKPDDWRVHAERLDDLCERTTGVFSRRSVEAAVAGVKSYSEYDDIIVNWR